MTDGGTDGELLACYLAGGAGSEGAFYSLVARHGSMVHHVCLRILGRADLAEEVAQAAFLVFARKAGTVRGDAGAFLQGVAFKAAICARKSELARRAREKEAAMVSMQRSGGGSAADWERSFRSSAFFNPLYCSIAEGFARRTR